MKSAAVSLITLTILAHAAANGAVLSVNSRRLHLGTAGAPEWEEFATHTPDARRLDLRFNATTNSRAATLFIRQDDVRQDWAVELNGRRLGKLFLMEADLVHALPVPAGVLREGGNVLSFFPPKENDDILLDEIILDDRPLGEALGEATLEISVTDAEGHKPLPCRLTLVDERGALAALQALASPVAARPGVVYTGDGRAKLGLRGGQYTVFASRGFEYSVATQRCELGPGEVRRLALELRREVPTPGLVSCDTHVHTLTHSGHGDATVEERMLTLAGEGIELPIATEHNLHVDYAEAAARTGVAAWFTPVPGNEVTTPAGHFNIFPVGAGARVPDFKLTDWPALMQELRATPGVRVVVLNHPRNVHNGFQPFAATNFNAVSGENRRGPEFTFDAMELMNSSAQQSDYLLVYRDWFALLNHGYRITALGSSDGHDVSRYIVGQGRTYIVAPDADPAHIDLSTACANLLAGRALVSMGLLARMTVDDRFTSGDLATALGRKIRVTVTVLGPSWVSATNVALFANGVRMREERIGGDRSARRTAGGGEKAKVTWTIPRPAHDVHLVAIATGPGVTAPFWAIPRPYQPTSRRWTSRVSGSTNPIWVDADANGRFQSARDYAQALIARHGVDLVKLLPALDAFDEAVAVQAASLCAAAGARLDSPEVGKALRSRALQVRQGFESYLASRE